MGRTSYAWYLWHWPIIGFGLLLNERNDESWDRAWVIAIAVIMSFGVAAASHVLVEQPIRRAPRLSANPARSLALGATLTLLPVALGAALLQADQSSTIVVTAPAPALNTAQPDTTATTPLTSTPAASTPTPSGPTPQAMSPAQAADDRTALEPFECHVGFLDEVTLPGCEYGDVDASVTIALVGDSHAEQWLPALDDAGREHGWRILSWTKSSCTVIDVPLRNDRLERDYQECEAWRDSIVTQLGGGDRLDMVVIADSFNYGEMVTDDEGDVIDDPRLLRESWRAGAERTFDDYANVADRAVLLRDTPWASSNVPTCLSEDPTQPERCAFPLDGHAWRDESLTNEELAVGADFTVEVDMTTAVCPTDPCQVVTNSGVIKYRDLHHLTRTFSLQLATELAHQIESVLVTTAGPPLTE